MDAIDPGPTDPDADPRHVFIERLALLWESSGLPRIAGRVMAFLLTANPEAQTSEQLALAVGASRASISTMTRLLIRAGFIDRVAVRGSRSDAFRAREGAPAALTREALGMISATRIVIEQGLAAVADDPSAVARMGEWRDLYAFMEIEYPALLRRWEQQWKERGQ